MVTFLIGFSFRLISEILNIPPEDFEHISDVAGQIEGIPTSKIRNSGIQNSAGNSGDDLEFLAEEETTGDLQQRDAKDVLLAALAQGKENTWSC